MPVSWDSGLAPRNTSSSAMDRRLSGAWPRHIGHITLATSLSPDGGGGILLGKVGSSQ